MNPQTTSPSAFEEFVRYVKRRLNILIGATILALGVALGVAGFVLITAQDTHDALCNLRNNLAQQIGDGRDQLKRSNDFLAKHPEGLPKLGLGRAVIQQQIAAQQQALDRQRANLHALDVLGCSAPEPVHQTATATITINTQSVRRH
jgi:hypothetical protein